MGGDRSSQVPNASPRGHPVERESERRDVAAFLSIFFFCSDKKEKRLEKEAIGKGETEKQRREREWGGGAQRDGYQSDGRGSLGGMDRYTSVYKVEAAQNPRH